MNATLDAELQAILDADPTLEDALDFEVDELEAGGDTDVFAHDGRYPMTRIPGPWPGELFAGRLPGRYPEQTTDDELAAIHRFGIRRLVCVVPGEDLAGHLKQPRYLAQAEAFFGDGLVHLEVEDWEVPTDDACFESIITQVHAALAQGTQVLTHCAAGCGRTSLFAAGVLIVAGLDPIEAIYTFQRHRGCGPETPEQVAYLVRLARRMRG